MKISEHQLKFQILGVCDYPSRVACNFTSSEINTTKSPVDVQTSQVSTEATSTAAPANNAFSQETQTPAPTGTLNGDKNMVMNKYEYNTQSK